MLRILICLVPLLLWLCINRGMAEVPTVRVGVLQFGTVNWELDVIRHRQLDKKNGFDLQVTGFGGKNATHVAIQGGSVDVIVSDWIWVNRQRGLGRDYSFAPYSTASGALMVGTDSGFASLMDLAGRKIGVAGGPLDKTWLLLRAYSLRTLGQNLELLIEPSFAAPPLLNQLALRGDLDGVINFWHYNARLEAGGFRPLLAMPAILQGLDIEGPLPLIGWVFSEQWANENRPAIDGLLRASFAAKSILRKSDQEWARLRDRMKADEDGIFEALVQGFRAGIPDCIGTAEIESARQAFGILASVGGESLTGSSTELHAGTFWPDHPWNSCRE